MAVYRCSICGELYDEEREGVPFSELPDDWRCPLCRSPKSAFVRVGEEAPAEKVTETEEPTEPSAESDEAIDLSYDPMLVQTDGGAMDEIHSMAVTGRSSSAAMDTQAPNVGFERILILGAQLSRFPLDDDAEVSLETVIGKKAEKPMVIGMPAFVSHMSFGALSYDDVAHVDVFNNSATARVCLYAQYAVEVGTVHLAVLNEHVVASA